MTDPGWKVPQLRKQKSSSNSCTRGQRRNEEPETPIIGQVAIVSDASQSSVPILGLPLSD